uniref:hypothetical protein n=1 Tax=Alteromonas mediterranea TaxID=314275 RepID=UPI0032B18716
IKVVNTKAKTSKRYDDARYKKMNKNTIACIRKYCANTAQIKPIVNSTSAASQKVLTLLITGCAKNLN